jgi:curli biogenesis system outer membrane secretion channel CsgG
MTRRSFAAVAALCAGLPFVIGPEAAEAEGLRKVLAVSRFENRTNWNGQLAINDAMADQLVDALVNSEQFTVLERQTVDDVLGEEDFANSGRVQKADSARTGKLTAAQILVKGTITEYQSKSKSQGQGWNFSGFRMKKNTSEAHVGLMIRLIDTTTGEVIFSERVSGSAEAGGMGFGVGVYEQQNQNQESMGEATQEAIDAAVELIAEKLRAIPFEGYVIRPGESDLLIAAGARAGAEVGDEFTVYTLGEELIDPVTGELLSREELEVGTIRIVEVKEKYARAAPVGPLGPVKRGDLIRERMGDLPPVAASAEDAGDVQAEVEE